MKTPTHILRLNGSDLPILISVADRMFARMQGLLGKSALDPGDGIFITPCNSIHMFFMRFAIDCVFVDKENRVVRIVDCIQPWRMARGGKGSYAVFELAAGAAQAHAIAVGDTLELQRFEHSTID